MLRPVTAVLVRMAYVGRIIEARLEGKLKQVFILFYRVNKKVPREAYLVRCRDKIIVSLVAWMLIMVNVESERFLL